MFMMVFDIIEQAGDFLGTTGLKSNFALLRNSLVLDQAQEIRETCELALQRIEQLKDAGGKSTVEKSIFRYVDLVVVATVC